LTDNLTEKQAAFQGINNPPIDELLTKSDSKYKLVLFAAKRARQINAYYSQLGEGLLEHVGPLVETGVQEKPLSIALREINAGVLEATEPGEESQAPDGEADEAPSIQAPTAVPDIPDIPRPDFGNDQPSA
jgi:DNA-directed RNA polymerase subunit omega